MNITYDEEADAAYIQIAKILAPGESATQVQMPVNNNVASDIILDFNEAGELLGIEVLSASAVLSADVLKDGVG